MTERDSPTLTFGKFKGRTLKSLLNTPEGIAYVRWLANSSNGLGLNQEFRLAAKAALKKAGL